MTTTQAETLGLKDIVQAQVWRVGIQGFPKTGKTWSALSFPNPIVLNLDNNIPRSHPKVLSGEVKQVPLYDGDYCREKLAVLPLRSDQPFPLHEAILKWTEKYGKLLTPDQTLIYDSMTRVGNRYDLHYTLNPFRAKKTSEEDHFKFWGYKLHIFTQIHSIIETLKCNVICIIHETEVYDEDGKIVGLKPIITGSFSNQIASHYTEWFRQRVIPFRDSSGNVVKDSETDKAKDRYIWEIKSDKITKCGGNLVSVIKDTFIDADYNVLIKAMNNQNQK